MYFLANDRVYEQAVAFLNSFRQHNPDVPLCLVPFADDVARVAALADRYDFTIWSDLAMLRRCDELSRRFHGEVLGQYRKVALWSGGYDEFVYVDCDTVVLRPVDFALDLLSDYDVVASHSDIPGIRRFVWRDSIMDTGALTAWQIRYAASTGFLASRRGVLDADRVCADPTEALALAPHMALECSEQPLLNYLIVTSGGRYSSLFTIALRTRDRTMPQEVWAGSDLGEVSGGQVLPPPNHPSVLLVHWAGQWERVRREGGDIPYRQLWEHYRSLAPR
ncbi:hypothetical protein GCM10009681_42580 [Luedemannella helvata]|uniref:Uncharacterized protein n=1 Tax=Luedemannella helvata TaxID=349315 RepID=A0ABN2KW67_9ACTN